MKIDITSLYFNGDTDSPGNTSSWGTALGQKRPNLDITVPGGLDVFNFINNNSFDFDPINNPNHQANIKQLDDKIILAAGRFDKVYVNDTLIEGPFFLLVIEETTGAWAGRKSIKYNNKISVDGESNQDFYNKIQDLFGLNACWFAFEIFPQDNILHISVIKVSDSLSRYDNAKVRKEHWESLISNFQNIKEKFKSYLLEVQKIKNLKTANEYINSLENVQSWFLKHNLISSDYVIWDINNDNTKIQNILNTDFKLEWAELNKVERGWYGTPWNRWNEFIKWFNLKSSEYNSNILDQFNLQLKNSGLFFTKKIINRFIASLCTKQFLILTGLSGSGKTKLAQAFATWISESNDQYLLVPVGADWTNREPLLGYPNSLEPQKYVTPESGVIQIITKSIENPDKPYFLILDEMNLSHVERYFADFLSAMESKESIKLYSDSDRYTKFDNDNKPVSETRVLDKFKLPSNLFIIGTVNIDETTYMFSPKVLDRANTIEFRLTEDDLDLFFQNSSSVKLSNLHEGSNESMPGLGFNQSKIFMDLVNKSNDKIDYSRIGDVLKTFFINLKNAGAEFGYRSINEIARLIGNLEYFGSSLDESIDIAVMQKLLPKLHGSRSKMIRVLPILADSCLIDLSSKTFLDEFVKGNDVFNVYKDKIKYLVSLEKISRMYKNALDNGFTSYAEA